MEINSEQAKFEGWAIVDALGHQRHAGFYARKVVGVQHADGTPYEKPKQDGDNFPF